MKLHKGLTTFKGNPLTLVGEKVNVGQAAPDFQAVANDLSEFRLSGFKGQTVLLISVPSLDTGVCDVETQRFNREAASLKNVKVVVLSMDLPFAQARWCGATGVKNVQTVSDHRDADFGQAYGMLIKELRLLARSVWVIDANGKVTYKELVSEMTHEPDYAAALDAVRKSAG